MIVSAAIEEDVDFVGLSILSGAHNHLFPRVVELLREKGAGDKAVFGGGIIPQEDVPGLKEAGIVEIFTPGTSMQNIVDFVNEKAAAKVS
jgi:methylmalonyl-CoA mutase C-terminal domain/subunit